MPIPAFSTSVLVSSNPNGFPPACITRRSIKSASVRCTAAPERAKITKKPVPPECYRVLPENLPVTERQPPPPRHNSIPYVGYFAEHFLGRFGDDGFNTLFKKYGPIFFSNFFLAPMYYLGSYDATCEILKDARFSAKNSFPGMQDLFGKDVLILMDGKDHEVARSALAPAFSPALFPSYFKNIVRRSVEIWERVEETVNRDGRILCDPIFREHYLAITIEMTTGIKVNSERSSLMGKLFADFVKAFTYPSFTPSHKRGMAARDKIRGILRDVIIENISVRRDIIEKLREYGDDVVKLGSKDISSGDVDVLLVSIANSTLSTDENEPLDEELIASLGRNMISLWFAGYLTSALTSTCGFFELGFREGILSRLKKEQDDIVGGEREVTYEQIVSKMPLLDSYLMEVLRLFPAVGSLWRRTTCDVEILGKYVPKDSRLIFDILGPHLDETRYSNGKEIIPERWLQHPKPPPILSFGSPGSPHYCIGAVFAKVMMKTTFATLLREYEFQLDPKQSRKYRRIPDHVPQSGVVVQKFERRSDT